MNLTYYQLYSVLNLALCLGIVWACICRLNAAVCRSSLRARTRYALLLAGAMASGAQPLLFNTLSGPGETIFAATILVGLLINMRRWAIQYHTHYRREEDQ